jgi:hypothetical protein
MVLPGRGVLVSDIDIKDGNVLDDCCLVLWDGDMPNALVASCW